MIPDNEYMSDEAHGRKIALEILATFTQDEYKLEYIHDELSEVGRERGRELDEEPEAFHRGYEAALEEALVALDRSDVLHLDNRQ